MPVQNNPFFPLYRTIFKKMPKTSSSLSVAELWQEYHDSLLLFIRSRVKDEELAADILQDVFVKILQKLDTLHETEKVRSWLFQIARNAIIDHVRKNKIRAYEEITHLHFEQGEEDDEAMRHMESCIRPMINSLPPTYRDALLLSEIEGLSQKALAERLGISYSGAKSRVQRGRIMLRKTLLDCCTFELDRYGKVLDYTPNPQPPCSDDC